MTHYDCLTSSDGRRTLEFAQDSEKVCSEGAPRTGEGTDRDHPSGLRKTTPQSIASQNFARSYRREYAGTVTRVQALQVAKKAAAAMGLKSSKLALIDQLFAFSKAADWTNPDVVPVVWPSNARLAESLGVCVSTMKHHLNGLVNAGLIAYSDGPTYQRRGRRDEQGTIIEAYGIDLSPLAVRFEELSELVEAASYMAREKKRFSYRRTVLRKEIQSLIFAALDDELPGPWRHAQARLDAIREQRPESLEDFQAQLDDLLMLQRELEDLYEEANQNENFKAAVAKFRPLQTTAEHANPESSRFEYGVVHSHDTPSPSSASGRMTLEIKPGDGEPTEPRRKTPEQARQDDVQFLSLPLVKDACPKLREYSTDIFQDWATLRGSGRRLCVATGINPQVWQEATQHLGGDLAVAALAVTVQKTDLGLVEKPGAYLRTLVKRGRAGELHISRSLFALASAAHAPSCSDQDDPDGLQTMTFPASGSISYSPWGDVVREHAPKPTPDVDMVADAFRRWAKNRDIDLTQPNIERILISFCQKWRVN